jgi:hypothetical protein
VTELAIATFEADLNGALELGGRALGWTEQHGRALLVSASLRAEALVLGALQRADTLRARSNARLDVPLTRRRSTGTEAQLSGAVLYHALTLPSVNTLFGDATPRTLLNRNLRLILQGYTAAGAPLRYFGTEVLALLGHPVALLGYDQTASGAVLIEVLVGLENPCVVRSAIKRESPAALYPLLRAAPAPQDFLARVVAGITKRLGATAVDVSASLPVESGVMTEPDESGTPAAVSIPLGVVEAVASPRVRITGDLLASTFALNEVEALAQAERDAGAPLSEAVLGPLRAAPLDGARLPDVLSALRAALAL